MNETLPHQEDRDDIGTFVQSNPNYYRQQFDRLDAAQGFAFSFNVSAALLGPIWLIIRRLWGMFWVFLILYKLHQCIGEEPIGWCRGAQARAGLNNCAI